MTEPNAPAGEIPGREHVERRVRRFAVLRAAQRALAPSSRALVADLEALRWIRESLRDLLVRLENDAETGGTPPELLQEELRQLDGALDGYASMLLAKLEGVPMAQLRASLSAETQPLRSEAMALLELCMEGESAPSRHLPAVDFLLTLLCTSQRDGVWIFDTDPANLNEAVRQRCAATPHCGSATESTIVRRFQKAAEQLAREEDVEAVLREMSAYKVETASFFFVPAVLRCIIGYNAAARNHFERRMLRSREFDSAIDEEIGGFEPLADYAEDAGARESFLQPHEYPGILAVQEAIQRRLLGESGFDDPAGRLAAQLDLSWLGEPERDAFVQPKGDASRVVRMTVVLGHLALQVPESPAELRALSLHEAQLDAWICALGEEVQREIDTRLRSDIQGALDLGDTKSRFLTAVLLVARRRRDVRKGPHGAVDSFSRDALQLVREYLLSARFHEKPRMFVDLLGGGWRRTAALSALLVLVGTVGITQLIPDNHPRAIQELSERQTLYLSAYLEGSYRDHADEGSMFIATASERWDRLQPHERRDEAGRMLERLLARGVVEVMIFDQRRVLQAHYKDGHWRSERAWR